jgi:hypothetical protein
VPFAGSGTVVETQKFSPAPTEVMAALKEHIKQWRHRQLAVIDAQGLRHQLDAALIEYREYERQQALDDAVEEASTLHQKAIWTLRIKTTAVATAQAALDKAISEHSAAEANEATCAVKLAAATAARDADGEIVDLRERPALFVAPKLNGRALEH